MSPIFEIDVIGADERAETALRESGLLGHGVPTNPIAGNVIGHIARPRVKTHSTEAAMERVESVLRASSYTELKHGQPLEP